MKSTAVSSYAAVKASKSTYPPVFPLIPALWRVGSLQFQLNKLFGKGSPTSCVHSRLVMLDSMLAAVHVNLPLCTIFKRLTFPKGTTKHKSLHQVHVYHKAHRQVCPQLNIEHQACKYQLKSPGAPWGMLRRLLRSPFSVCCCSQLGCVCAGGGSWFAVITMATSCW